MFKYSNTIVCTFTPIHIVTWLISSFATAAPRRHLPLAVTPTVQLRSYMKKKRSDLRTDNETVGYKVMKIIIGV